MVSAISSTPTCDQLHEINVSDSYSLHEKSIKVTAAGRGACQEFRTQMIKLIIKQRRQRKRNLLLDDFAAGGDQVKLFCLN